MNDPVDNNCAVVFEEAMNSHTTGAMKYTKTKHKTIVVMTLAVRRGANDGGGVGRADD
jgi:hypothetical protein